MQNDMHKCKNGRADGGAGVEKRIFKKVLTRGKSYTIIRCNKVKGNDREEVRVTITRIESFRLV